MEKRISVNIENREEIVHVSQGQVLLQALLEAGVEISHSCGGNGTCGTCVIQVTHGLSALAERNEIESELANDRGFRPEERLSCQTEIKIPLSIRIP